MFSIVLLSTVAIAAGQATTAAPYGTSTYEAPTPSPTPGYATTDYYTMGDAWAPMPAAPPVPSTSVCLPSAVTACTDNLSASLRGKSTRDSVCNSYPEFMRCLEEEAQCPEFILDNISESCATACKPNQCKKKEKNCTARRATKCSDDYVPCVQDSGADKDKVCVCVGQYGGCLKEAGCPTEQLDNACTSAGCSAQQCAGEAEGNCSQQQLSFCQNAMTTCVEDAQGDLRQTCQCQGFYAHCLAFAGCAKEFSESVHSTCENSGLCETEQCRPLGRCDNTAVGQCTERMHACRYRAGGDREALCTCQGYFTNCLKIAKCKQQTIQSANMNCRRQMCSESQCAPRDAGFRNDKDVLDTPASHATLALVAAVVALVAAF